MIIENMHRLIRDSNPNQKTQARITDIVAYLKSWSLKHVILGLSGGIDSAFVLMLLVEAQKQHKFTINTVFFKHSLHDNEADESLVKELIAPYSINHTTMDISGIVAQTNRQDGICDPIVDTQYAYALMYTLLFRQAQIVGGVTIGTTNKDELGIGWFGKNSDMVVDIQPIHDFHKFEIYRSTLCNQIPDAIKRSVPDGNLISGLTDEDVFGCSYDIVSSVVDLLNRDQIRTNDLSDYPLLKEVIDNNAHKLVKPRTHFNPVFL